MFDVYKLAQKFDSHALREELSGFFKLMNSKEIFDHLTIRRGSMNGLPISTIDYELNSWLNYNNSNLLKYKSFNALDIIIAKDDHESLDFCLKLFEDMTCFSNSKIKQQISYEQILMLIFALRCNSKKCISLFNDKKIIQSLRDEKILENSVVQNLTLWHHLDNSVANCSWLNDNINDWKTYFVNKHPNLPFSQWLQEFSNPNGRTNFLENLFIELNKKHHSYFFNPNSISENDLKTRLRDSIGPTSSIMGLSNAILSLPIENQFHHLNNSFLVFNKKNQFLNKGQKIILNFALLSLLQQIESNYATTNYFNNLKNDNSWEKMFSNFIKQIKPAEGIEEITSRMINKLNASCEVSIFERNIPLSSKLTTKTRFKRI